MGTLMSLAFMYHGNNNPCNSSKPPMKPSRTMYPFILLYSIMLYFSIKQVLDDAENKSRRERIKLSLWVFWIVFEVFLLLNGISYCSGWSMFSFIILMRIAVVYVLNLAFSSSTAYKTSLEKFTNSLPVVVGLQTVVPINSPNKNT